MVCNVFKCILSSTDVVYNKITHDFWDLRSQFSSSSFSLVLLQTMMSCHHQISPERFKNDTSYFTSKHEKLKRNISACVFDMMLTTKMITVFFFISFFFFFPYFTSNHDIFLDQISPGSFRKTLKDLEMTLLILLQSMKAEDKQFCVSLLHTVLLDTKMSE